MTTPAPTNVENLNTSLPDPDNLSTTEGATKPALTLSDFGISASAPAVNRADIAAGVYNEVGGAKQALLNQYQGRRNQVADEARMQDEALKGQFATSRRFSSSANAFIQHVSTENNKKIAELEMQRDDAMANFDFKMAQLIDQRVASAREEQSQRIDDIFKMIELSNKTVGKSSRDNAIAGLVKQGVTDPAQLLDYLNRDDAGNVTGDFTLKEIREALDNLTPKATKDALISFDTKATGSLLAAGFNSEDIKGMQEDLNHGASLEDILGGYDDPMRQSAVRKALGIAEDAENITPGTGAKNGIDESIIRTRLFTKLAPLMNKGALSDSDRKVIDSTISNFRSAGLSEQAILDVFSGFPQDVTTPYNNSFRDAVIQSTDDQGKQTDVLSKVGTLLGKKNYSAAMNLVENTGMEKAKRVDPDNYMGSGTTSSYTKKIDAIKSLLAEVGIVGPFEGTLQSQLRKFKGKDAQRIQSAVTGLVADMRHDLSGSAVTPQEAKFLEPLIPDIADKKSNFYEKLDALQTNVLRQHNSTREVGGLPTVNVKQILDPTERLQLYSNDTSSGLFGGEDTNAPDL